MSTLPPGLQAFVDDDVALLPAGLTDDDRAQLVEVLIERADTARLDRLGSSPDKQLAKSARKALHVLKTRGARVSTVPRTYVAQGPFAAVETPSYASIVDGRGERVVWYVETADAGFTVFETELSETSGVLSITAVEVSRKAWRDQVQRMKKNERAVVGEIPGLHARVLIERAYRTMLAAGRAAPEGFAGVHLRIQATADELAAPHPARALASDGATTDAELAALFEHEELLLLVPPKETIGALDAAVGEVVTSELVLGPGQKLARLEEAIARVADETMTRVVRERVADRLLEAALLMIGRRGEAGREPARVAIAAADRALGAGAPHDHPTLLAMYRRLVPAELMLKLADS